MKLIKYFFEYILIIILFILFKLDLNFLSSFRVEIIKSDVLSFSKASKVKSKKSSSVINTFDPS